MSGVSYPPPNPYFSGINFNSGFFTSLTDYLTEAIANSKYLRLIGGILRGNLGIKRTPAVELDVNGKVFINNNVFTTPSNGVYGGDGTRLILAPGTVSATPYSLGIATTTLWYGVPDGANHIFYTGTNERLRIKGDGNVGIGTNDPQTKLDVRGKINSEIPGAVTGLPENGTYGGNGTRLILYPGSASTVAYSLGISGSRLWFAGPSDVTHAFYAGTGEKMKIDSGGSISCTGNIYMGSDNLYPDIRLGSANGNNIAIATAAGSFSSSAAINDMVLRSKNRLLLQSGEGSAGIIIATNNNVGIGTSTGINNIFQIGDGARLRISNGSNDYTIIGSKDVDDSANTSIEIYGNTHPSFPGKIYYFATTATGDHTFYTNGSSTLANTLANFAPTKNTFYKNVRAVNYENEGVLYPHSTLINSGGSSLSGYFIPVNDYTNSLMVCAFSHDNPSYTYWRGHVFIGNNNQILGVSAPLLGSNLLVESFIQQTTLIQFIRAVPSISYNSSVQLRVKIYG
jgi:hypothetical protein